MPDRDRVAYSPCVGMEFYYQLRSASEYLIKIVSVVDTRVCITYVIDGTLQEWYDNREQPWRKTEVGYDQSSWEAMLIGSNCGRVVLLKAQEEIHTWEV
jgi:hypothetical protein